MGKKENRPDACTASGTASTCDYDSTSVYAGQDMTENELIRTVTEEYRLIRELIRTPSLFLKTQLDACG